MDSNDVKVMVYEDEPLVDVAPTDIRYVERLADQYRATLVDELEIKTALAELETARDKAKGAILALAIAEDLINGKNADTRKRQQAALLDENMVYQGALVAVKTGATKVASAEIDRKHAEKLIDLTRSWLESQKGVGQLLPCTEEHTVEGCYDQQVFECVRESGCLPEQAFEFNDLAAWAIDNGFVTVDTPETGPGRDV